MTKRKVKFSEDTGTEEVENSAAKSRRFKENHSLDSDEEDGAAVADLGVAEIKNDPKMCDANDAEENILHEDDIEGQEDETIRDDEGITVTPFNLKDEMEEGHFDAQGNYIANKNDELVTDGWLESVDWKKVSKPPKQKQSQEESTPKIEPIKVKQCMVEIMKPGEDVFKALRRLAGKKKPISTAERWKRKKANIKEIPLSDEEKKMKEMLLKLTGYADSLMSNGEVQIYEKTYEKLNYEIKQKESQFLDAPMEGVDDSDDEDDALEAAFKGTSATDVKEEREEVSDDKEGAESALNEVHWLYKLNEDDDESKLQGPYSSSQMGKWKQDGKFEGGVFCRKTDSDGGQFYNSRRIDFELYM